MRGLSQGFKRRPPRSVVRTVMYRSLSSSECVDRRIERVIRSCVQDLTTRRTLLEAADIAGLHPTYLSKRFRAVVGLTFAEWNARIRVEEAKRLLRFLDLSVIAVAASVGYLDSTTFARVFRRAEGMSPTAYRRAALSRSKQS
jgi:AraC-like DNA-binding protein